VLTTKRNAASGNEIVALAEMIAALGRRVEESSDVMNMRSALFSSVGWNNQFLEQPLEQPTTNPTTSSVDRPQGLLSLQYGGGSGEDR